MSDRIQERVASDHDLARTLNKYRGRAGVAVRALPHAGMAVAAVVSSGGIRMPDPAVVERTGITGEGIECDPAQVREVRAQAASRTGASAEGEATDRAFGRKRAAQPTREVDVTIRVEPVSLEGTLRSPARALGLVVFVHGSGSSRFSTRNRYVAESLNAAGFATLLFDLLTAREEAIDARTGELRFDIALLTDRLIGALDWLETQPALCSLSVGLFGASTGAAAALNGAAARPRQVKAVVSRGGRPDLAQDALALVRAPTLLIVGGRDEVVIGLNERAAARLRCEHRLEIVPGATHLFEESGKLEAVAQLARDWFERHLCQSEPPQSGTDHD